MAKTPNRNARRAAARGGPAPAPARRPPAELTRAQKRLLTAITVLIGPLLLLALEGALRLGGFGGAPPLFVPFPGAPGYLVPNRELATRWFGDQAQGIRPTPDLLRAEKAPGAFRVFVQGESSAQGFPYFGSAAFPALLHQRLQATFPGREVEVVNTGLTAVSSYPVLDLADEIIRQKPDAVIVYTGHNEYYGVLGAASGGSPALTRTYLRLRRLRVTQLLERAIGGLRGGGAPERPRTMMEIMAADRLVPLGSPTYRRGVEQFRTNLGALLRRYRDAGIPVYVGTLASNERGQPPFVSAVSPGTDSAAWGGLYASAVSALSRGDTTAGLAQLERALRMDGAPAQARYLHARVLDARGRTADARAEYLAARDRDALRFRAPEEFNTVIRQQAARYGATVVGVRERLAAASPGGVVGDELMTEHLHPNVDGNFLIADAFYEALRSRGAGGGDWSRAVPAAQARAHAAVAAVDSLSGSYTVRRLKAGWPFQATSVEALRRVDAEVPRTLLDSLAMGMARQQVIWPDAVRQEVRWFAGQRDYARAARTAEAMALKLRQEAGPAATAARLWQNAGRPDAALRWLTEAERRSPSAAVALEIGHARMGLGDHAGALAAYRRAAALAPGDRRAASAIRAAEALPALERAAAADPGNAKTQVDLGYVLLLLGQPERARTLAERVLARDPGSAPARTLLQRITRTPAPSAPEGP